MTKEMKEALMSFTKNISTFFSSDSAVKPEDSSAKVYSENELKVSELAVGGKVETINQDGTLAPATDGAYEMEDGSKFTVKDGQIESIESIKGKAPAPVEAAATEEPAPAEQPDALAELTSRIDGIEQAIADLAASVQALVDAEQKEDAEKAVMKSEVEAFTKQVEELSTNLKVLAKIPANFSQTSTSNIVADSNKEKMKDLAAIMADALK